MTYTNQWLKSLLASFLLWAFLFGSLPLTAQDIPPTEALSLGSSVFVFRGSSKASQKKYTSSASSRVDRTKKQRVASRRKISNQYNNLAKVTTRRARIKTVTAEELPGYLRKTPEEASVALTGAGLYYFKRDEVDKSFEYYREAIKLDSSNQDAKFGLSDSLVAKGDQLVEADEAGKAKYLYQEAIVYNDKNSAAYAGLGEIFDALKEKDQAIANYEKALEFDRELTEIYTPLGILYYETGEIAKADELLTKALATSRDDAETQYFLGLIRFGQTRYQDALSAFTQAIKLNPESAEAYYYLGETYDKLKRNAEAVAAYEKAVQLDPRNADAWFALGVMNYNQGNYEGALTAYKEVVRLQNTNGAAHANLADTYRQLDRAGAAEGSYRLAVAFVKDDAELYSKYGYILGRQSKWSSAIDALNKAIALSPDAIDYTNLGWAYYNAAQDDLRFNRKTKAVENLTQARDALQRAVELNSKLAPSYLNLGVTLNDLGQSQEAVKALQRAVELRPDWVFAVNELGIAYRKAGDFENAVKYFKKAIDLDSKFANGYYNLGESEFRRGNKKEAQKAHASLQKLNPNLANLLAAIMVGAIRE